MSDGFTLAFAVAKGAIELLEVIAPAALNALKGGAGHEEALAAARAELPPALDTIIEDRARHERVRAMHPRISAADASVLARLAESQVLTQEEREALLRAADIVETHAMEVT